MTLALLALAIVPVAWGADLPDYSSQAAPHIPKSCPGGFDAYAMVKVKGLRDRKGNLRVEVYPDNDTDFLVNRLGRTEVPTPAGEPEICVELPGRGKYAIVVHQDRNADNSFDLFKDGFGFSNNPKLGFSKPDVSEVEFQAKGLVTHLTVNLHYLLQPNSSKPKGPRH